MQVKTKTKDCKTIAIYNKDKQPKKYTIITTAQNILQAIKTIY